MKRNFDLILSDLRVYCDNVNPFFYNYFREEEIESWESFLEDFYPWESEKDVWSETIKFL